MTKKSSKPTLGDQVWTESTGSSVTGRAVTATLYVSPDGNGSDGSSWSNAYTTIQDALDAASTDANDCTLILVGPTATYYDINTTGDPTWSGNYEIKGTHRLWAPVRNEHSDATSIFKFTGKASIEDLALFSTDNGAGGSVGGVIFTKSGYRVRHCGFNSEATTHANTSIHIDGSAAFVRGGRIEDVQIQGHVTHTTGLYMDTAKINTTTRVNFHNCLTGIQIINADSDGNYFWQLEIGDCAIGLDLDAGNEQHFESVSFHGNTVNVDDEVGDHGWSNIFGQFAIEMSPADLTGTSITAGDGAYGSDTELIAANAIDKPFKVISYQLAPSHDENTLIRLSANSGAPYFTESIFATKKNKATGAGMGTDFVFNKGTRISASVHSPDSGRTVAIWLEVQEI